MLGVCFRPIGVYATLVVYIPHSCSSVLLSLGDGFVRVQEVISRMMGVVTELRTRLNVQERIRGEARGIKKIKSCFNSFVVQLDVLPAPAFLMKPARLAKEKWLPGCKRMNCSCPFLSPTFTTFLPSSCWAAHCDCRPTSSYCLLGSTQEEGKRFVY